MKIIDRIKDGVTDFLGLCITIATLTQLWEKSITWVWDGLIGLAVGLALFLLPEDWLIDTIKKAATKFTKDDSNS